MGQVRHQFQPSRALAWQQWANLFVPGAGSNMRGSGVQYPCSPRLTALCSLVEPTSRCIVAPVEPPSREASGFPAQFPRQRVHVDRPAAGAIRWPHTIGGSPGSAAASRARSIPLGCPMRGAQASATSHPRERPPTLAGRPSHGQAHQGPFESLGSLGANGARSRHAKNLPSSRHIAAPP